MSSGERTNDSATMSTPSGSPIARCSRSSSGTGAGRRAGRGCSVPGATRRRRRSRPRPRSRGPVSHGRDPQPHAAVGEVQDLARLNRRSARLSRPTCGGRALPSSPETNTTRSPGLRSARSSAARRCAASAPADPGESRRGDRRGRRVADAPRGLCVLLGGAVREVQPRDVHACRDHPLERPGPAKRGRSWRRSSCGAAPVEPTQRRMSGRLRGGARHLDVAPPQLPANHRGVGRMPPTGPQRYFSRWNCRLYEAFRPAPALPSPIAT